LKNCTSNLHTHTTFSDGKNTPEEYVKKAIEAGMSSLGFSDHAYVPNDLGFSMKEGVLPEYLKEIDRLKEKYSGLLEIYSGLEGDAYYMPNRKGLDYLIGSVHYLFDERTGKYHCVDYPSDHPGDAIRDIRDKVNGGDIQKTVELYYQAIINMVSRHKIDILGHIDLIVKRNGCEKYFDSESDWYLRLTSRAVEAVKASGCILEVNTGAVNRGFTTHPYPEKNVLSQVFAAGIPVTISSDAHSAEDIISNFDLAASVLKKAGYRSIIQMLNGKFTEVGLE
jgi:histidinol-phosphatase (PHP family)